MGKEGQQLKRENRTKGRFAQAGETRARPTVVGGQWQRVELKGRCHKG